MLRKKGNVYKIDTPKTTLIFGMDAAMLYYGKRLTVPVPDYDFLRGNGKKRNEDKRPSFEFAPEVVCSFSDGSFSPHFSFLRARPADKPLSPLPSSYSDSDEKNASQTLCFEFADETAKLKLFVYYTVFDDSDVVCASCRLLNGGKREVGIKKFPSLCLKIYGRDFSFVTFEEKEGKTYRYSAAARGGCILSNGGTEYSSRSFSSCVLLEKAGHVYAFDLVTAGAFEENVQTGDSTRISVFAPSDRRLAPGESAFSAEALMTYAETAEEAKEALRSFSEKHLARGKKKGKLRPPTVRLCGEKEIPNDISQLVGQWAGAGAELFVLQGIAFEKLLCPNTAKKISALSETVRKAGMKFGVEFAPEMLDTSGEAYAKHPELTLKSSVREGERRLNLADLRAQKYLVRILSTALSGIKVSYVGWADEGSARELPAGYWEGLYGVMEKITERFPSVLFEGRKKRKNLAVRCFLPGFEDLPAAMLSGKWSAEEISDENAALKKKEISFYKRTAPLLRGGREYLVKGGRIFVDLNRQTAVALFENAERVSFKGLDEVTVYSVNEINPNCCSVKEMFLCTGELLMNGSIPLGLPQEKRIFLVRKAKREKNE